MSVITEKTETMVSTHCGEPHRELMRIKFGVFIKRRQEAKISASNHFLATSNAILGIQMYINAKKLTTSK